MGLDMYAYRINHPAPATVNFSPPDDAELFFQWRKRPNLHGWMEILNITKGGRGEFICVTVALTASDFSNLQRFVEHYLLAETTGFYSAKANPRKKPTIWHSLPRGAK